MLIRTVTSTDVIQKLYEVTAEPASFATSQHVDGGMRGGAEGHKTGGKN